jgi:hypothetical protein
LSPPYDSELKEDFKEKIIEAKKENLRLVKRISQAEEDVKDLEEDLKSGFKGVCKYSLVYLSFQNPKKP